MESRLITIGNIALFEYPEVDNPEFDLDKNGVLFIHGYDLNMGGHNIRAAKRFELGLKNYKTLGCYKEAIRKIKGDIEPVILGQHINIDNCLILAKV